jgi:hypothetical protein
MKICNRCKEIKDEGEFYFRKDNQKYRNECKECISKYQKQYRQDNKEKLAEQKKQYGQKNKERIKKYKKQYRLDNKERLTEQEHQYYLKNREKILKRQKQYEQKNKEKIRKRRRQYYLENREKILEHQKQYYQENRKEILEKKKQYALTHRKETNLQIKKRLETDICFKLRLLVSTSIRVALKNNNGGKNGGSILDFLPCTIPELREHLEKQFESWMNWENHGNYDPNKDTWQIDHIIPHSNFHYETMDCDEFRKCWALENLRPFKAICNIKKGNKV